MKEWKYVDASNNLPEEQPVVDGADDADPLVVLERTLLANTEITSHIPRFVEPRERGSSCCPPR